MQPAGGRPVASVWGPKEDPREGKTDPREVKKGPREIKKEVKYVTKPPVKGGLGQDQGWHPVSSHILVPKKAPGRPGEGKMPEVGGLAYP